MLLTQIVRLKLNSSEKDMLTELCHLSKNRFYTLFGKIFSPDRDYQRYIITCQTLEGNQTVTILNIDRSDAPEFQQEMHLNFNKNCL